VSFEHDPHWTAHGHRLAAAAIDRHLQKIGVFGDGVVAREPEDVGAPPGR